MNLSIGVCMAFLLAVCAVGCNDDTPGNSDVQTSGCTGDGCGNTTDGSNNGTNNGTSGGTNNGTGGGTNNGTTGDGGCTAPEIDCGGACVDPRTDMQRCGASGTCEGDDAGFACGAGEACVEGACVLDCPGESIDCGGTCIDPNTNDMFCGASGSCTGDNTGRQCAAPASCQEGLCVCGPGQVFCGGTCIDPNTDGTFCGAFGDCTDEGAGETCEDELTCINGSCACPNNQALCEGLCVDTTSDPAHCGDCGRPCGQDEACLGSECEAVGFAGALPPTGGAWRYNNETGLDSGVGFCAVSFPDNNLQTTVCTDAMLAFLSPTGQMASVVDLEGAVVTSFWADKPGAPGEERCDFGGLWDHGSGDNGEGGAFRTLDNASGVVGERAFTFCSEAHWVPCCFVSP